MATLTQYTKADFVSLNKGGFSAKEIRKYTNRGGYCVLSLFAVYKSEFMLLKQGKSVMGCGVIRYKWSREIKSFGWWLYGIWICPDMRGKGYGNVLMNKLLDELKNRHVSIVRLVVKDDNARAIHLYEKTGFIVEQKQDTYIIMRYEL